MEVESGPARSDSTLSVVRIQPLKKKMISVEFGDPEIEELYQLHSLNRKRTELFRAFLYGSILYALAQAAITTYWIHTPAYATGEEDTFYLIGTATFLGLILVSSIGSLVHLCISPHIHVLLWLGSILSHIVLRNESLPLRTGIGWAILETFLIWVAVPTRLKIAAFYALAISLSHSAAVFCKGSDQPLTGRQMGANVALLLSVNGLGLLSFYLSDKKQRRAFIDTRQSLEMKLVIEEQAKEQERLLLSVLPEHLALKMRQDLEAAVDGQFKKIYMNRHENVSILYADIVGFTAISSTYSASELVKILNELFARFDRLADRYHQLRIKILGDCYYCICGAPEEREDHAVQSVYMGLSMVKAIKYVRETTNSPVDMRVGIHTGAILAGVLGQRQWQFDVYSKDVELANKMESSGMPGKVHISEKTLSYLHGEFEVEPAHGEKREEILKIAGIKTFFIIRATKPANQQMKREETVNKEYELNSTYVEDSTSAVEENFCSKEEEKESYRRRLKEELISRNGYRDLARQSNWFTLNFNELGKEREFRIHKEAYSGITAVASPASLIATAVAAAFAFSFSIFILVPVLVGFFILAALSLLIVESESLRGRLTSASRMLKSLENKPWVKLLFTTLTILVLAFSNGLFFVPCFEAGEVCNSPNVSKTEENNVDPPVVLPKTSVPFSGLGCLFPAYIPLSLTSYFLVITLLPGFWLKSALLLAVALAHIAILACPSLSTIFDCSQVYSFSKDPDLIPDYHYAIIFIITVVFILTLLNQRVEKSSRVLFLWKIEVEEQRERASQLRQKNEALVYNILPQHVAAHFLGNRRRKHEELYSQSYSEVGILFASMPNFSDFYSEESVNNQGLECLRFLNEVISDFDALLELPKFMDNIIKIKTISSTYMAASGLSPLKQARAEDELKIRWSHLSLLVEFVFEMKRAITSINEQSFNHFVLKMGINHGPITAGVIGARKPHYDIWGNSVNVASRMESTGKAGCIQVTEETYRILRIYGYEFEQRGLVNVKGKGQLMTYYLTGRGPDLSKEEVDRLVQECLTPS